MCRALFVFTCLSGVIVSAVSAKGPKYDDPSQVDADYAVQGEYVGSVLTDNGETPIGIQVIALGHGQFEAVGYIGGLPGDGWNGKEPIRTKGARDGEKVVFRNDHAIGTIHDDVELPGDRSTRAAPIKPGHSPGPVYLQDHGCPVRYRNIWVVEQ